MTQIKVKHISNDCDFITIDTIREKFFSEEVVSRQYVSWELFKKVARSWEYENIRDRHYDWAYSSDRKMWYTPSNLNAIIRRQSRKEVGRMIGVWLRCIFCKSNNTKRKSK